MSTDHHVRSLAGRTVSQPSMLAMQAEDLGSAFSRYPRGGSEMSSSSPALS
jgi:hypothetical protein